MRPNAGGGGRPPPSPPRDETERGRQAALAAAAEAKTALLHSVSHEFRTPLTLLLGPLADMLAAPGTATLDAHREDLRTAHRAGLRLSRLGDALLLAAQTQGGRLHPPARRQRTGPATPRASPACSAPRSSTQGCG